MRADLYRRVAWQLKTRGGVQVYAWMPVMAFELPAEHPMAKHTKAASGASKIKYFRDALRADPGVSPEAVGRLTAKFDADLSHVRIRRGAAPAPTAEDAPAPAAVPQVLPPAPAFDPHAFSLIVVMTKQGPAGLEAKLSTIDSVDQLRALARAQHVAVDTALVALPDVRAAIIAGTAQRIADRRAAAS